ncbi:MAG: hypothetical protein LBR53_03510 [Deltaproteobacteria bacterium]|jgi:hypothetical protein|nr:hypothetical protein [Deltaproteobacteria bacterium]
MNPVQLTYDNFSNYQAPSAVRAASVEYTDPSPNIVSQIMKSGAPKPHATISNNMVAAVDKYTPPPGINLPHYLALDVDKAKEGPTTVVDAIQRYFNVRPRREPLADPQDIASTDSYPTLIMDEISNNADLKPYHFSVNGIERKTDVNTFFTEAGHMRVRVVGPGVASIKTPATESEEPLEVGPIERASPYYPPAYASEIAANRLAYLFDPSRKMPVMHFGPNLNRGLNDTLSSVAYTLGPMRAFLGNGRNAWTEPGANAYSSAGGYGSIPQLNLSAMDFFMV